MWIWFFAFIATVLVWAGPLVTAALGFEVAVAWRIAATALIALVVGAVLVYRRYRAGASARAFEREILKQSEQQAMNVRPDRRAEILELRERLQAAISTLERQRGKSLSALPWYVIVGPPGAGKTTALRQSGLPFAFTDANGGALRGIGGTRNCDWWFTNEAILLDTAGRYAVAEDDRGEWLSFLDLLKRYRKERPINGVILAVSASELADAREDGVTALSKRLRARIDEIMSRLDMVVPVYVMFTKTDLIDGFVEFWGELRKSDRDQLFGATFALRDIPRLDPARAFELEFRRLCSMVQAHAVRRVGNERDYFARRKITDFPLEFRALERSLSEFIGVLFMRNRYQGTPLFRGFYFTSGTQEGSPVSRVLAEVSRAFGLSPLSAAERGEPKSYFVTDLFRRVIFPDRNVAARTRAGARRHLLYRLALASLSVLMSLLIVVPAFVSFVRNRSMVGMTSQLVHDAAVETRQSDWLDARTLHAKLSRLDDLRESLDRLEKWEAEGAPLGLSWGMYMGGTLERGVESAYATYVSAIFDRITRPELERTLGALVAVPAESPAYGRAYDDLKLYLMLAEPARLDSVWAGPLIAGVAAKALHSPAPEADSKLLLPHARKYLELAAKRKPWQLDAKLVAQTRQVLSRAPQIERQYGALVHAAEEEVPPIRGQDVFYGSIAPFVMFKKGVKVSGAYTKAGYELVKKQLAQRERLLNSEAWVLDEPSSGKDSAEVEATIGKLQDMYTSRFSAAWQAFFLDLDMPRPETDERTLAMLSALNEAEYPYQRLIRTLAENVRLDEGDGFLSKALKKRLEQRKRQILTQSKLTALVSPASPASPAGQPRSPMEDDFATLLDFGSPKAGQRIAPGLAQYLGFLTDIIAALSDARDTALPRERAVKQKSIEVKFELARRGTEKLLDGLGENRALMSGLLMGPLKARGAPAH